MLRPEHGGAFLTSSAARQVSGFAETIKAPVKAGHNKGH